MSVVLNIHYEHYVENNSDEERIYWFMERNQDFYNYVKDFTGSCDQHNIYIH